MPLRHISHVGCLDTTYTELFHTQCSCADSLVLESKGRTGHVADFKIQSLALPGFFLECLQVHLSCRVLGLLAWEPLWVPDQPLPFHCCIFLFLGRPSIPPSQHPLSLHFLCLSLWLLTGGQGSSSPFSGLPFCHTDLYFWPNSLAVGEEIVWAQVPDGKGKRGQEPQRQSHRPVLSFIPSIHTLASTLL